jgi:hypothetical protein
MKGGAMLVRFEEDPKDPPKEEKRKAPEAKETELKPCGEPEAKRQCSGIELKPCDGPCEEEFSDSEYED